MIVNLGITIELSVGPQDQKVIREAFQSSKAQMHNWFVDGLMTGTNRIRSGLQDPRPFAATVDPAQQQEVITNLLARWYFLARRHAPDLAWSVASWQVEQWFPPPAPQAPGRPTSALPPPPAATAAAAAAGGRRRGAAFATHRTGGP
jgi:hypothetical protein